MLEQLRRYLKSFNFRGLFSHLGWDNPKSAAFTLTLPSGTYQATPVAMLSGIGVWQVSPIPPKDELALAYQEVSTRQNENITIFVQNTESVWYWAKREKNKLYPRISYYSKEQSGDAILSKLQYLAVDFDERDDEGQLSLALATERLQKALDISGVTKVFFQKFQDSRLIFTDLIQGIANESDKAYYASVILNRLMFIYFLQKKGFLPSADYLKEKLREYKGYYQNFLLDLFFEGFAKEESERSQAIRQKVGAIKYLNGSIFTKHPLELKYPNINIPDEAFQRLYHLFDSFAWALDDSPSGNDNEISPYVLGYIFERYINQKALGAYYTRPELTNYLCRNTIESYIARRMGQETLEELLLELTPGQAEELLEEVLPKLSVLDPACGSGAFLVAALDSLYQIYAAIIDKAQKMGVAERFFSEAKKHRSWGYFIKKRIIAHNLFGVDIVPEAGEIARLRLFLSLVASAKTVDELEPLPNIDFNIQAGNSLIGLMKVSNQEYARAFPNRDMFAKEYPELLLERAKLLEDYPDAQRDNFVLKAKLESNRTEAMAALNRVLLAQMSAQDIKFKEATWDGEKVGQAKVRGLQLADIEALTPFHWGFEFEQVMGRGGFDVILANPPWDVWKPESKEFLQEFSDTISKNKMTIKDFDKERKVLMQNLEIKAAYLSYLSRFPHVAAYFKKAYDHQSAVVQGKQTGGDQNLYKLFVELCFKLLRPTGECGILVQSTIYNGKASTGLRKLLFENTKIKGMFTFENRKGIFDIHKSFKFVVLTFSKGGPTTSFPAVFMQHSLENLERFPKEVGTILEVETIKRTSPDTWSLDESSSEGELELMEVLNQHPSLQSKEPWELALKSGFHMTKDRYLFRAEPSPTRWPLYLGRTMHQFDHKWAGPQYWIEESEGNQALAKTSLDTQQYRLVFRRVASNTNERTIIATILPPRVFIAESLHAIKNPLLPVEVQLYLCGMMNSFVFDYFIRQRVDMNISQFFIYQAPMPKTHPLQAQVAQMAAKLICTTPEFDALAKEAGLRGYQDGVSDPQERLALRAELDALCALIYGLNPQQFAYILEHFPNVDQEHKKKALENFEALWPS